MVKKSKKPDINQKKMVALGVLTFIFVALGFLAYQFRSHDRQLSELSSIKVAQLATLVVENLSVPVPEDAKTGARYISAAKILLPADNSMDRQLVYYYSPSDGDIPEELTLSSRTAIGQASSKVLGAQDVERVFEHVPELQACSRGFLVTFAPSEHAEYPLTFEKRLNDGRTTYVYANTACDTNRESVTEYLRQIESY